MQSIILKKGRESIFQKRHHWIFSGAIATYPSFENGDILSIYSSEKKLLGYGYFHKELSLAGRILSFSEQDPLEALKEALFKAIEKRKTLPLNTNAFRLVHAEADELPGLIVDRYGDYLVLQIGTLGMEKLKNIIVSHLVLLLPEIKGIYERSSSNSRKEEGLKEFSGPLFQQVPQEVEIFENDLHFLVSIPNGQKTGFFLDHRETRSLVASYAKDKKVLNAFSYTGAFTLYALKGGASSVDNVELSSPANAMAKKNIALNNYPASSVNFFEKDVFTFLKENALDYDLIILDPPAFARRKKDLTSAYQAYKQLNSLAMKNKKTHFLSTSSCSYHLEENTFKKLLFESALETGRRLSILSTYRLAPDHPISLFHPETNYLKSYLLFVD